MTRGRGTVRKWHGFLPVSVLALLASTPVFAAEGTAAKVFAGPSLLGIPVEFILFAIVLTFVAFVHVNTMVTAIVGAIVIALYKIVFSPFNEGSGIGGLAIHLEHEWVILTNLLLLLLGFAILAKHFEDSGVPKVLPKFLPDDWKGGVALLAIIFVMSAFLDNIAAAMIGGAIAHTVFRGQVHIGFLAAIVAASNAGGSGSVVGDTTTTMMWIAGASPLEVLPAYVAAAVAFLIFAIPASLQQHRLQPIMKDEPVGGVAVDWTRVGIVAFILILAVATNVTINNAFKDIADYFPWLGAAVWVAILVSTPLRQPHWHELASAFKSAVFLLSLVLCASMMPVEALPVASWVTTFGLGFISAVFDNIPLTALAINQGGYDWSFLAWAVGFGGSMIWFGSTAGVALSSQYPEARSAVKWLRYGWYVPVAYIVGFFALLLIIGWNPHESSVPL